jgi:hypothetical protein
VTRKLAPTSRGAIKLARQFGDALLCVRHRTDPQAEFRYTTVELLVEKVAMQPRLEKMVTLRIGPGEYALHAVIRAAGGKWDPVIKLWHLPKRVATILRLGQRVVQK